MKTGRMAALLLALTGAALAVCLILFLTSGRGASLDPLPRPSLTAAETGEGPLNINTAGQAELEELPGIGPVKAEAVLAYREAYGPFSCLDELDDVPGFGEKTIQGLQGLITIEEETNEDSSGRR